MEQAELLRTVDELLKQKSFEEADALIDKQESSQLDNARALLLCAKVKAGMQKYPEARALLKRLLALAPDNYAAHIELAKVAINLEQLSEAEHQIAEAEKLKGANHATWQLRFRLASAKNDLNEKIRTLTELVACQPIFNINHFKQLIRLHLLRDEHVVARALVEQYCSHLSPEQYLLVSADIDEDAGDIDAIFASLHHALALNSQDVDVIARLIHVHTQIGDDANAIRLLEQTIDNGLADIRIYRQIRRLMLPPVLLTKVVDWAKSLPESASEIEKKVAADIIDVAREDSDDDILTTGTLSGSNQAAGADDITFLRPLIHDDKSEMIVAAVPGADTVVLVFAGLANRIGISIRKLDSYLATLNASVIYLRDSSRLLYNDGIPGVAASYEGTISAISNTIEQLGASKVISFGVSGGGFASIRYGLELNAKKIVGVAAVTNVSADFMKDDGRAKIVINRMKKFRPELLDMKLLIEETPSRPPIQLYYAAQKRQDKLQANNLKGMAGVSLNEIEASTRHDLLTQFEEEGRLMQFLTEMIS